MKTKLLYISFLLSAFLLIGVVGGMDKMSIGLVPGLIISFMLCGIFCYSAWEIEKLEVDEYD